MHEIGLEFPAGVASVRGMGRKPLGMKPTTVRLPDDTIGRIEAQVGNRRVASFIREAVEKELKGREAKRPAKD